MHASTQPLHPSLACSWRRLWSLCVQFSSTLGHPQRWTTVAQLANCGTDLPYPASYRHPFGSIDRRTNFSKRIAVICDLHWRQQTTFQLVCEHDLEGIVIKLKESPHAHNRWLKIKNLNYSQAKDRHKAFEKK